MSDNAEIPDVVREVLAEKRTVTCSTCDHERPYAEGMPWWRDDPVVIENGWMDEHCCPECGRHTHDEGRVTDA